MIGNVLETGWIIGDSWCEGVVDDKEEAGGIGLMDDVEGRVDLEGVIVESVGIEEIDFIEGVEVEIELFSDVYWISHDK